MRWCAFWCADVAPLCTTVLHVELHGQGLYQLLATYISRSCLSAGGHAPAVMYVQGEDGEKSLVAAVRWADACAGCVHIVRCVYADLISDLAASI
jgi:hypothetical protein